MLRSMLTAFRQHYPQGGLVSDLLSIHDGLYIVRAVVVVENQTLATGLAAHGVLETAEDTAYVRALNHLGSADMGYGPPPALATPPISAPQAVGRPQAVPLAAVPDEPVGYCKNRLADSPDTEGTPALKMAPDPDLGLFPQDSAPNFGDQSPALDLGLEATVMIPPEANGVIPPPPLTQDLMGLDGVPTPSIDLSDIIAQTDVELQRLGWNVNQGREFLEKTYGKRSRHDLTDEELLEFLLFLETQPTPGL